MALRLVRYLYIDDDTGRLVADCADAPRHQVPGVLNRAAAGSAVEIPILDASGRVPADQGAPVAQASSPLPTPTAENEGTIMTHQHEDPLTKTEVVMCVRNSAGAYEWIEIAEST